ncbi:MAG TPA: hypothetical protein VMW10_01160 [Alphaproteobacteria bacterium]|nr:hypothetical protein [Alphaproteobacteria bacterium]
MKNILKNKVILIGGIITVIMVSILYLSLDSFYSDGGFRTTQDSIASTQQVNLTGLQELQASGSALIRFSVLEKKLLPFQGPKIIVDGMAEFHGFLKGIPSTFFAYQRKSPNLKHIFRRWIFTQSKSVRPDLVTPEAEEAKKYGFNYIKLNIGSKSIPADKHIDDIIDFYEGLPQNAWVHFHCAHGKGRTTILLVLLDIVKNAPKVSLEDIIRRHHLLGSEDLMITDVWERGTYSKEQLEERKEFVKKFYAFICQKKTGGIQRWSDWNLENPLLNSAFLGGSNK